MAPTSWTHHRATIGALKKHGRSDDDAAVVAARQKMRAAQAEDYIRRLVDSAPPLSEEQRDRLALLLRGAAA
jgi:hypothetical protein